jgi:hypothetical protein
MKRRGRGLVEAPRRRATAIARSGGARKRRARWRWLLGLGSGWAVWVVGWPGMVEGCILVSAS